MKNNRILALAVTTLLAAHHNVSFANTITLTVAGSDSALVYAKELPSTTSVLKLPSDDVTNPMPVGVRVSQTNPVFVKFGLLNGAKFGGTGLSTLTLACKSASESATVSTYNVSAVKTLGGVGFPNVTFQLTPAGGTASLGSACLLSLDGVTVSGLTDKTLSGRVEYSDAGVGKTNLTKGKFITFAQGLQATYTPASPSYKIDVASGSKKFINGSTTVAGTPLGNVKYENLSNNARNTSGTTTLPQDVLSSVYLTISGPAVGSVHSGNAGVSGVFISTATCTAIANTVYSTTYSGSTVTFTVPVTGIAATNGGVDVCIKGNNSTVISDGQITANMKVKTAVTGMSPILTSTRNSLALLKKNGSSTKVLVLPPSTSLDKAFVRIYNIGSGSGRVLGTLYSDKGVKLGSGVLSTSLAPNGVAVLDSLGIEKALGLTAPWQGRAWLQIEAEFKGLRSQALVRSPNNVLTEFSDGACTSSTMCGDSN